MILIETKNHGYINSDYVAQVLIRKNGLFIVTKEGQKMKICEATDLDDASSKQKMFISLVADRIVHTDMTSQNFYRES